jgi:beta-carotene 15,15'-dioxygenase
VTAPLHPDPATGRRIFRTVLVPSWILVLVALPLAAVALGWPDWARWLPFVLSVLVFGLPHGAVDHIVALRLWGRPGAGALLVIFVAYLAIAAGYAALWLAAPAAAFLLFIGLTWGHWGQGDLHALVGLHGARHLSQRSDRVLAAFVRGGLPMLVPLIAYPEVYRDVAAILIGRVAPGDLDALAWAFEDAFRWAVGVGLAAAVLWLLVRGSRQDPRGARTDALEIALLVALFVLVEPILAVGLYFCFWHSPRHIARLLALDPVAASWLRTGPGWRAWVRFGAAAAPLTLLAIALVAGLQWIIPVPADDVAAWMGVYLIGIACLTLPHVIVVGWLDHAQRVWSPSR